MKITEKGNEILNKWEKIYASALEKERELRNDPNYEEGWSILLSDEYLDTIEDEIELEFFGYMDDIVDHLRECEQMFGKDWEYFPGFTCQELIDTICGSYAWLA